VQLGLNAEEIAAAVGMKTSSWWGKPLLFFLRYFELPFRARIRVRPEPPPLAWSQLVASLRLERANPGERRLGRRDRRSLWVFVVAILGATACAAANGQTEPRHEERGWRVGVFGGWYSGATPYSLRGPVSGDVRLRSAATFGLRVAYDIGLRIGVEASWTRARSKIGFVRSPRESLEFRRLDTYDLDGKVYVSQRPWRGFLFAGLGAVSTGSSFGGTNLTAHEGAGVEAFLTAHWAVRLDARFRETYGNRGLGDQFAYCDRYGCFAYRHDWYANREVSGGISYAF